MQHQIITDLNSRYTAKQYDKTKKISAENMDVIKEAIRLSASSINSQQIGRASCRERVCLYV